MTTSNNDDDDIEPVDDKYSLCKWCGISIRWMRNKRTEKVIPYTVTDKRYHLCSQRPESSLPKHECQWCRQPIHFDSSQRSHAGCFLPLSADGSRHWCSGSPFAKAHRLKKWLLVLPLPLK
jgi:hypothetical protein